MLIQHTGDLLFDIRVEKEQGHGETVGYDISPQFGLVQIYRPLPRRYPVLAPPPRWTTPTSK